jgi:hypothetical protein
MVNFQHRKHSVIIRLVSYFPAQSPWRLRHLYHGTSLPILSLAVRILLSKPSFWVHCCSHALNSFGIPSSVFNNEATYGSPKLNSTEIMLQAQHSDFCGQGIAKLITQHYKCLSLHGDYAETYFKSPTVTYPCCRFNI